MRNRRDDLRNIALIVGAGALGVIGTVFVTKATVTTSAVADRMVVRQQAVVEARERLEEAHQRQVVGVVSGSEDRITVRVRGSGDDRASVPGVLMRSSVQPIIYIDGVRVNGPRDEAMKLLDPDGIDRIEILKGPAARQRYGSEAANGVIQIFTKSNEEASGKEDDSGR